MFNPNNLSQFYGSETLYYRTNPKLLRYTDGIRYLADGASWLIDAVYSHLACNEKARNEPFQLWKLEKVGKKWELTMRRDTDEKPIVKQVIEYSDFPMDSFEWYVCDGVMMLKSEY